MSAEPIPFGLGRALAGLALLAGLTMAASASAAPAANPPGAAASLSGVWFNSDFVPAKMFDPEGQVVLTAEGKRPPLQLWAAALLDKRIELAKHGQTYATTLSRCLPTGMPAMMYYPANPMQILESKGQVTMLVEQLTLFRVIRLNVSHLSHPAPSYFGDSIGHWEGDTLVVDTIGLNDLTTLDEPGMPHSKDLHIVERYRRTGANAIELVMSLDDPKTFTRPWTLVTHFKREPPDRPLEEWYCENQRNPVGANGLTTSGSSANH